MRMPHLRLLVIGLLLVIFMVVQVELLILIRAPKAGRFMPVARNPYLLLDTATGTECLGVPKDRAGEMLNWLVFSERDEDVHDSYSAAITTYAALQKHYVEQYQKEHLKPEPAGEDQNDPVLQEMLNKVAAVNKTDATADTAASQKTKTEFDKLVRLLHSLDSIPICSRQ